MTQATDGLVGSGLHYTWRFTAADYGNRVYGLQDDSQPADASCYYARQGVAHDLRYERWYANGQKQWNPVVARMFADDNLIAIVNGAANSVNQPASNSELLLVRFDPSDWDSKPDATDIKRVEHVLPDLSTTATYPAGQAASRRIPELGGYPVSSPVEVHQ
mgnify:CR=1 FL=1